MIIKEAVQKINLYIDLLYVHGNDGVVLNKFLDFKNTVEFSGFTLKQLLTLVQQGKFNLDDNYQTILFDLLETGSFEDLNKITSETPLGIFDLLSLPILDAKKVNVIWDELGVSDLESLKCECLNKNISCLDGFGEVFENKILDNISYFLNSKSKLLLSDAELLAETIIQEIMDYIPDLKIEIVGEVKRFFNVVSKVQFAIDNYFRKDVFEILNNHDLFDKDIENSSDNCWVGYLIDVDCPIEIVSLNDARGVHLIELNSSSDYFSSFKFDSASKTLSEVEVYNSIDLEFLPAEMREKQNLPLIKSGSFKYDKVVQLKDIKGCINVHSNYSDGQNSISEMAASCKQLGLTYMGVSDYLKSAVDRGGLREEDVYKQQQEINEWNSRSSIFKIFKGIKSDILDDGSLDYDHTILHQFDFIISSINSNFNMDKLTATNRLIKAIENPFTTILGHPSGRLLLKRKGYELDYDKVIDACVANDVCIEINSNPYKLDLDWSYVRSAADKGVILSVNPDAHDSLAIHDMQYGLKVAMKAGLYPEQILNCLSLIEIEGYLNNKK